MQLIVWVIQPDKLIFLRYLINYLRALRVAIRATICGVLRGKLLIPQDATLTGIRKLSTILRIVLDPKPTQVD